MEQSPPMAAADAIEADRCSSKIMGAFGDGDAAHCQ